MWNEVTELCFTKIVAKKRDIVLERKLKAAIISKTQLAHQHASLQTARDTILNKPLVKKTALGESQYNVAVIKEEVLSVTLRFLDDMTEQCKLLEGALEA